MSCYVSHTTIDCHDAYALSQWWKQVLGYVDLDSDPNGPGHEECMIRDPRSGHRLLFIEVPDTELPAKRIHLDLAARPRDAGDRDSVSRDSVSRAEQRDEEIERIRALGAVEVADHRGEHGPGTGWVTFADPEGNWFCVVRSPAEGAVAASD